MDTKDIQQLLQENQSLREEVASLQKQFGSAVSISSQIDGLYNQITGLENEIRKLNAENSDLKHRLQISAQKNLDIEKSFSDEKAQLELLNDKTIKGINMKMEEMRNTMTNEISKQQRIIGQLKESQKIIEDQKTKLEKQLSEIMAKVSEYFRINNQDYETTINLVNSSIRKEQFREKHQSKLNKFKSKIKKLKNENIGLKKQIKTIQNNFKQKIGENTNEQTEMKNQIEKQIIQIQSLTKTNEQLLKENGTLSTNIQCMEKANETKQFEQLLQLNQRIEQLSKNNVQLNDENEQLNKQLKSFLNQVNELKKVKKQLLDTNNLNQTELSNQKTTSSKLTKELSTIVDERDKLKTDVIELHKRIKELITTGKELKTELNSQINDNKKYKLYLNQIEIIIENQNKEIVELKNLRDQFFGLNTKQNLVIQKYEEIVHKLTKEKYSYEQQIKEIKQKYSNILQPFDESCLLPIATSCLGIFPKELNQIILSISNNKTISTPTKMKQIFSIINEWYNNKNKNMYNDYESIRQKLNLFEEKYKLFVNLIQQLFPEITKPLNDLIFDDNMQALFINSIKELRFSTNESKEKYQNIESKILNLFLMLKCNDIDEVYNKIKNIKECLTQQIKINNNYKNSNHKLKKLIKSQNLQKKDIQINISEFENKIIDLQKQVLQIESEKEAIIEQKQQQIHENNLCFEAKINEFEKRNQLLNNKIKELSLKLRTSEEKLINLQKDYEKEKQANTLFQLQIQKKKKEIQKYQNQNHFNLKQDEKIKEINVKKNDSIIETYQDKIKELNSNNSQIQEKLEKIQNDNNSFRIQIEELLLKLQHSEDKNKNLTSDFTRKLKLKDSYYKTELFSKEAKFKETIENYKKKVEEIQQNFIALVASHFCIMFDTKEGLNINNFDVFLKNISEKFKELLRDDLAVRELLKLGPKQSIPNAISSFILSNN